MKHNNDFRHDLEVGRLGEKALDSILSNQKIEVKTDLLASKTGNVFVEYESRSKPSGISTTEADWWAFVIAKNQIVLLRTSRVKELSRKYWSRRIKGGDSNTSMGVLVPIKDLLGL